MHPQSALGCWAQHSVNPSPARLTRATIRIDQQALQSVDIPKWGEITTALKKSIDAAVPMGCPAYFATFPSSFPCAHNSNQRSPRRSKQPNRYEI